MSTDSASFVPQQYAADIAYEYAGMINTLIYLSQEARNANLELVSLHMDIAIAELKEYQSLKAKTG